MVIPFRYGSATRLVWRFSEELFNCQKLLVSFMKKLKLLKNLIINIIHKMANRSNGHQIERLISFMEDHPDFAKGNIKDSNGAESSSHLWDALTEILNSMGPPNKPWKLWRKVWHDLKEDTRKKLREEKTYVGGTGGGPKKAPISLNHERIITLLHLRESVHGLGGLRFGGAMGSQIPDEENITSLVQSTASNSRTVHPISNEPPFTTHTNNSDLHHLSLNAPSSSTGTPLNESTESSNVIMHHPSISLPITITTNSRSQHPSSNLPSTAVTTANQPISTNSRMTPSNKSSTPRILHRANRPDFISTMKKYTESTESKLTEILSSVNKNIALNEKILEINQKNLEINQRKLEIKEREAQMKEDHYKLLNLYYQKKLDALPK